MHRRIVSCYHLARSILTVQAPLSVLSVASPFDDSYSTCTERAAIVDAPRRRLTRAEYDAGLGDSDDFDVASDDEAYIHNPADHAPPSLVGSVASRG